MAGFKPERGRRNLPSTRNHATFHKTWRVDGNGRRKYLLRKWFNLHLFDKLSALYTIYQNARKAFLVEYEIYTTAPLPRGKERLAKVIELSARYLKAREKVVPICETYLKTISDNREKYLEKHPQPREARIQMSCAIGRLQGILESLRLKNRDGYPQIMDDWVYILKVRRYYRGMRGLSPGKK